MITLQQLEAFFVETRATHEAGRSSWSIDDECRWSYFFVDPDREKLLPIADHMEPLGYEIVGMLDPEESDDNPVYYLRVDRIEIHSPASLYERNRTMYAIAAQFGVSDYDGMDVGAVDGP
jgi:hypothetical protein